MQAYNISVSMNVIYYCMQYLYIAEFDEYINFCDLLQPIT